MMVRCDKVVASGFVLARKKRIKWG